MNATNAYNRLNANVAGLKKASEKLSSGYRINRAGDDAAGLAISEKMRSQIKGLNQAIRNSQDGINMIQTFEGAAQETHSILQRMKELATESANGTYDNRTDRAAIQLEFDQLNDELNQIADTDYNGTIVLNGGVMSDGLKASDGEFNYDKSGTVDPSAALDVTKYTTTTRPTTEAAGGIVDAHQYGKDEADALWDKLGIKGTDVTSLDVTFVRDANGAWIAKGVTNLKEGDAHDKDSEVKIDESKIASVTTKGVDGTADVTGKGGFTVDGTNVNAIFNAHDSKEGDYLTITFYNTAGKTYAPANIGISEKTPVPSDTGFKLKFTLDSNIKDSDLNDAQKEALDALGKTEFTAKFTAGTKKYDTLAIAAGDTSGVTLDAGDGKTLKFTASDGTVVTLGTIEQESEAITPATVTATVDNVTSTTAANAPTAADTTANVTTAGTYTYVDGTLGWLSDSATAATITVNQVNGAPAGASAKGDKLVINGGAVDAANSSIGGATPTAVTLTGAAPADGTYIHDGNSWYLDSEYVAAGDISSTAAGGFTAGDTVEVSVSGGNADLTFKLNIDGYNKAQTTGITAKSVETTGDALTAVTGDKATPGVSNSDSFKQSKAIMNYAEEITLQTGARTKDSVNFTFKYNTDETADMGKLKANLDLSSRANGLNTANLSLANQKDANYAIDQIDKAINKTSMVRATFGSIQNRLEHKISNLTTTNENLTEAESSIRDTDMASEMMNYTKFNILQQAAQSMLAQANQQPQSVLQLLG